MSKPKWEEHFEEFVETLADRLQQGHEEYDDASFNRSPEDLDREIDEEILDVIGWAYVKWAARRQQRHD